MDRQIVYPGSIPLDTDLLNVQRNTLLALGSLAKTVLGNSPVVDGLACSPSSPGFAVTIGPGTVSVVMQLDDIAFGSLPADPASVVKTGVNAGYISLQLGTTPDPATLGLRRTPAGVCNLSSVRNLVLRCRSGHSLHLIRILALSGSTA
jgi:hypothetical protein